MLTSAHIISSSADLEEMLLIIYNFLYLFFSILQIQIQICYKMYIYYDLFVA